MQPPASPSPAERPPIEAAGNQEARLHLEGVDRLKTIVDTQVSEFGDSRYGTLVDNMKGLQAALETVDTSVAQGDLATGQSVLEQAPRPRKLNDEVRDTLVDLHRTERGEPTPDQRHQAMSGLLLEVTRDIDTLTDPKKGNLRYTEPEVQAHKAVEAAFKERHRNYFDDIQPEGEVLQNGEQRTPHEVADDAYDLLLSYTEDKLRQPDLTAEKAESLRTARDLLHTERKGWKEQFDAQNEAVVTVMGMVGKDNEQFSEAKIKEAVRDCVGDEIPRLKELVEAARDTTDPYERFNILNSLQRQESPVKNAEAFEAWKQKRAEKAKANEQQQTEAMVDDARKTIDAIHSGSPVVETEAGDKSTPEAQFENDIAPLPQGWTYLIHGTDKVKWPTDSDTVAIGDKEGGLSGLYAVTVHQSELERSRGNDITAEFSKTPNPVELRIAFPSDEALRLRKTAELGLDDKQVRLMRKVYNLPGYSNIPDGQTLLKIGDGEGRDGREAHYYVPASVAEQYATSVKKEMGRDIALPKIAQEVSPVAQQIETQITPPQAEPTQPEQPKAPEVVEVPANPYDQFVKAAISRVPQNVLLESVTAVAQDRLANGEQVDLNALRQQLGKRLSSDSLNIEPAKLEALAKRVQQNGFYESGGGIWQAQSNPNTPQGRIAAEARNLVREITADILANG